MNRGFGVEVDGRYEDKGEEDIKGQQEGNDICDVQAI